MQQPGVVNQLPISQVLFICRCRVLWVCIKLLTYTAFHPHSGDMVVGRVVTYAHVIRLHSSRLYVFAYVQLLALISRSPAQVIQHSVND
jgi:hypothetical protein